MISLTIRISLLCISCISATVVDFACTTNGKFNERAVICANVYPDAACAALYGAPPVAGSDVDRSQACYTTDGTSIDHELKSLSSEICARQCGYCCQSPGYSCANNPRPRVTCSQVTHRMCRNPVWRDLLIEDCPNVCGFCQKGCVDNIPDCAMDKAICRRMGMEQFVAINCRRTCGYCSSTSLTTTGSGDSAVSCAFYPPDNSPNCEGWATNGFCINPLFTTRFRRTVCATTCKIC